jgi:hypothetical protein
MGTASICFFFFLLLFFPTQLLNEHTSKTRERRTAKDRVRQTRKGIKVRQAGGWERGRCGCSQIIQPSSTPWYETSSSDRPCSKS